MAAVSVADALEDILQSGLAFRGTLGPFAWQECCSGHSTTLQPISTSSGNKLVPNLTQSHTASSMQGPRAQPLTLPAKPHHVLQLPMQQKAASGMPIPLFCPTLPRRKAQLLRGATDCKLPERLGCQTNIFLFTTEHKYLAAHLI